MGGSATMVLTLDGATSNLSVDRWNGYMVKLKSPMSLARTTIQLPMGVRRFALVPLRPHIPRLPRRVAL